MFVAFCGNRYYIAETIGDIFTKLIYLGEIESVKDFADSGINIYRLDAAPLRLEIIIPPPIIKIL